MRTMQHVQGQGCPGKLTKRSQVGRHRVSHVLLRAQPDRDIARDAREEQSLGLEQDWEAGLNSAILGLALPALGTELIDPLLSLCDTAFIGRVGPDHLAGLGYASGVFTFTFLLFNFLSTASAPLIAQALARKDVAAAKQTTGQAFTLALVLGVVLCCLLELNSEAAIGFISGTSTDSAASSIAVDYLRVRAFGIPASLLSTAAGGAFRGLLNTQTPLRIAIAINVVHLVTSPFLIFGLGPVTGFGASGAAAATVLAEWIGAAAFVLLLRNTRLGLPSLQIPEVSQVGEFLQAGTAVLIRTAALQATLLLSTATISRSGVGGADSVTLAAHQISLQSWFVLSFFLDSMAVAATGLVADRLGRNNQQQARMAAQRVVTIALVLSSVVAVLIGVDPQSVAKIFTDSSEVQSAAMAPLLLVAAMQPINAVVFVGDGVFQGAADFKYLALAMACACGFAAALMETGPGNLETVWLALLLLQAGRAVSLLLRYFDVVEIFDGSPLKLRNQKSST